MTILKQMLITSVLFLSFTLSVDATDIPGTNGVPDLTKGGVLKRINLRWVGPVGIFCGSWRPRGQKMEDVRQLQVLQIKEGSPAEGILEIDDVILGAEGTGAAKVPLFKGADRALIPIANAITEAEAHDPALLKLLIWRPVKKESDKKATPPKKVDLRSVSKMLKSYTEGKTMTVTITLKHFGRYSDTAPYNCEKSKRVLRQGVQALYDSNDPGKFSLGILSLLAADDPTNPDNAKNQARAKEWAHKMLKPERDPGAWQSGAELIVLSEYYMKTKDEAVFPELVRRAEHHARGVSWFGTTGHRWADKKPDGSFGGRIGGYGPINCSGTMGFLGLSLARKAGIKSSAIDAAVERQRIFFGHWALRGGIHYGEMPYGIGGGTHDRNGVHAMTGLALGLQEGKEDKAKYFVNMATLTSYGTRLYAHGGPFFGQVWQPVAAGQGGMKTANLRFNEIRWHLELKRFRDGARIHDPTHQKYRGFSNSATALLFYALPLKQLYVTGRGQKDSLKLTDAEFDELLACKNFDAKKATNEELIAALSRFLGMQRGTAAGQLSERIKKDPKSPESIALVDKLLALAADSKVSPTGRTGACKVFQTLKKKQGSLDDPTDQKIVKTMVSLLKDPDAYIRFGGMKVLQTFHPNFSQVAVKPYANDIMDAIIATERPTFPLDKEDPVQWAHGEMGAFLFGTVLAKDLDGVDREKLVAAMRSVLRTPNGSARNIASRSLNNLAMEDALELADVLVDNIKLPPPANSMGGSGAPNAQTILANYRFEEALPLSLIYGTGHARKNKIPEKYGQAAFTIHASPEMIRALGKLMLVDSRLDAYKLLEEMKKIPAPEKMHTFKQFNSISAAQSTLTLPTSETKLVLDAINYADRDGTSTTYTWRKVYGAGNVSFTPNASGKSKETTVSFVDKKPGTYRFEVTMADTLGLTVLRKTVDVTLNDRSGKLPTNRPPQAKSLNLQATAGLPTSVILSGTDPDGDDLGYIVTKQPTHGRLTGTGGTLSYIPDFGFNGTDSVSYNAIDGQGATAPGTVSIKVSDKDVGVAVYEGFDYSPGAIQERGGDPSFGWKGPWTNTKGTKDFYHVVDGSFSYPALPSTGGKLTKGQRWWALSRSFDTSVLSEHKLIENGSELWFSMFVKQPKDNMAFKFVGTDITFGFKMESRKGEIRPTLNGQEKSRSRPLKYADGPNMIVIHCVWGKTDADSDSMRIYRVFDAPEYGPMFIETPICVLEGAIPQAKIEKISMVGFEKGDIDEIRIGPTLHSVMVGTKPLAPSKQ